MACTLSFSSGNEDFTATAGSTFTLDVTGPAGSGLVIVSMAYNGTAVSAAPFTFTVAPAASGTQFLFIHYEAIVPGAALQIVETCGGGATQILASRFFDPAGPGTGLTITGF